MEKYLYKLTSAYCLYNGVAIQKQEGSNIEFAILNYEDEFLKAKLISSFYEYISYVRKQSDCPKVFFKSPEVNFYRANKSVIKKYILKNKPNLYKKISKYVSAVSLILLLAGCKTNNIQKEYEYEYKVMENSLSNDMSVQLSLINNSNKSILSFEVYMYCCIYNEQSDFQEDSHLISKKITTTINPCTQQILIFDIEPFVDYDMENLENKFYLDELYLCNVQFES